MKCGVEIKKGLQLQRSWTLILCFNSGVHIQLRCSCEKFIISLPRISCGAIHIQLRCSCEKFIISLPRMKCGAIHIQLRCSCEKFIISLPCISCGAIHIQLRCSCEKFIISLPRISCGAIHIKPLLRFFINFLHPISLFMKRTMNRNMLDLAWCLSVCMCNTGFFINPLW